MMDARRLAYVRRNHPWDDDWNEHMLAVCDLAERALLTDEEAEAVRRCIRNNFPGPYDPVNAVLRRLLPAPERVEHRLSIVDIDYRPELRCSCGEKFKAGDWHDRIALAAAHAGIGGTEE